VRPRLCVLSMLVLLSGLCVAQSEKAPSPDLGRQPEPTRKARVVITNDDLPMARTDSESDPAAPDQKGAEDNSSDRGKRDGGKPSTPVSDSEKLVSLKAKIDKLADQQNAYKASISQLEEKLSKADTEFRIDMYNNALANNRESLQIVTNQREQEEKELADLQKKMKPQQKAATPN
jgi:predicted RNase H-like nuclease (RuvC/YqgF family)